MVHTCKTIGIREYQRNLYKNIPSPDQDLIVTNRGQAVFMVSASAQNLNQAASDTLRGENEETTIHNHQG